MVVSVGPSLPAYWDGPRYQDSIGRIDQSSNRIFWTEEIHLVRAGATG